MAKRRGNPTITVRLPRALFDALYAWSKQTGKSVSDLVRDAIEDHMTWEGLPYDKCADAPLDGQVNVTDLDA